MAQRVYVGGLPMGTHEDELRAHINSLLALAGGAAAPGSPVTSCKVRGGGAAGQSAGRQCGPGGAGRGAGQAD